MIQETTIKISLADLERLIVHQEAINESNKITQRENLDWLTESESKLEKLKSIYGFLCNKMIDKLIEATYEHWDNIELK